MQNYAWNGHIWCDICRLVYLYRNRYYKRHMYMVRDFSSKYVRYFRAIGKKLFTGKVRYRIVTEVLESEYFLIYETY
jgi:hypothetical protein